jgi:hypothetical protein
MLRKRLLWAGIVESLLRIACLARESQIHVHAHALLSATLIRRILFLLARKFCTQTRQIVSHFFSLSPTHNSTRSWHEKERGKESVYSAKTWEFSFDFQNRQKKKKKKKKDCLESSQKWMS